MKLSKEMLSPLGILRVRVERTTYEKVFRAWYEKYIKGFGLIFAGVMIFSAPIPRALERPSVFIIRMGTALALVGFGVYEIVKSSK